MARTALTVYPITSAGRADPAATTGIVDGHKVANSGGNVFLEFNNSVASPRTITIQTTAQVGEYNVEDKTIVIPASAQRFKTRYFEPSLFNYPAGTTDAGMFYLDYPVGQHADITVRAFSL